jgi:poly(rC)-binding protein 2/3/4
MSADSGSDIRVSKEKLPSCALLKDELCQVGFFSIEFNLVVLCHHPLQSFQDCAFRRLFLTFRDISFLQITGDLESVKKGLNAVTQVLFTHPPRETDVLPVAHPSGSSSHTFNRSDGLPPGMQPNSHLPLQGPPHARGPFDLIDQRPNTAPFPTFPDQRPNIPPFPAFPDVMHGHASVPPEPLTFRLLCSSDKVGSIIGKGGNSIKTIQKDTGCEIKIVETVPKSEYHIIVISGPAVTTLLLTFPW